MKELLALLPETRRKLLQFLCKHHHDDRLQTIQHISEEVKLSFHTTRKIVYEFASLGLVKVYEVGRVKIVVPTDKLKEVCEVLEVE